MKCGVAVLLKHKVVLWVHLSPLLHAYKSVKPCTIG